MINMKYYLSFRYLESYVKFILRHRN